MRSTPNIRRLFRAGFATIPLLVVGLTLALLATSARGNDKDVFTAKHVAKLRTVRSAVVSPDGGYVAYTLSVPRDPCGGESGPAWSELHVVSVSGESRPFITGEVSIGGIDWTPDGKGISFIAKRGSDKHKSLYVIPIDGGEARRVLKHKTDIGSYSWGPDGERVAFTAKDEEPKDEKKLEKKGFNAEIFEEQYRDTRLYIVTVDVEEAEPELFEVPGIPSAVTWSPAGNWIAMALAPTPTIDDYYMQRKLHVFDAENGSIVSSFKNPGKLGPGRWSPDGKRLALRSSQDIHDPSAGRLMVADPSTGTLTNIVPDYEGDFMSVRWQDADTIMYIADEGVWSTLGEIRFDGTARKPHIPMGRHALTSLTVSRDGKTAAMVSHSPTHPREVFVMRHGQHGPRRITDSNPWLADVRLAKQEVVTYKARDGAMIQGLLIRPLDEQPGKHYPLILNVHGGPEAHYLNGWITRYASPGQLGAAGGYAMFYPNYRGSTGRGVAFAKAHQADYGGKEFDDLVDAVDHLVATGLVDNDRVGVTGGSYGGFAAAWCSTYHTDRFAAAVMFVGVSNHVSKAGTTDIPNEMTLVHARKRVWEDWDFFFERSPIRYVEQAKTPLLILHGKNDTRVPPSQSLELYRNLKVIGRAPVRLVWYPGEGHGNRKSAARYDYTLRMMRWFDHYLKGPAGPVPPYELDYGCDFEKDDDASNEDEPDE